jgi:hypothetical protein
VNRRAQGEVPDKKEKQEQGQRQPRIPGPPGTPDRFGPDRPSREHDPAEYHTHFRRGSGKAVQARILQPEIDRTGDSNQGEGQQSAPGGRHVHVEDLLSQALAGLNWGICQCEHVHYRETSESCRTQAESTADQPSRAIGCSIGSAHSSTTAENARVHNVTNTMS